MLWGNQVYSGKYRMIVCLDVFCPVYLVACVRVPSVAIAVQLYEVARHLASSVRASFNGQTQSS